MFFFIFACVVSSNANAGFNAILTAMIYVAYVGLLAAVFNKKRSVSPLLFVGAALSSSSFFFSCGCKDRGQAVGVTRRRLCAPVPEQSKRKHRILGVSYLYIKLRIAQSVMERTGGVLVGTWRNTGCSVLTRVLRKLSRVSLLPPYFLRGAYSFLPAGKLSLAPLHPNFVSCRVLVSTVSGCHRRSRISSTSSRPPVEIPVLCLVS